MPIRQHLPKISWSTKYENSIMGWTIRSIKACHLLKLIGPGQTCTTVRDYATDFAKSPPQKIILWRYRNRTLANTKVTSKAFAQQNFTHPRKWEPIRSYSIGFPPSTLLGESSLVILKSILSLYTTPQNTLRKALHPDYYMNPETGYVDGLAPDVFNDHLTHCLDAIRESLMCSSDIK